MLAAAMKVTFEGDASQISIGAGPLIEAVGLVRRAVVDPTNCVARLTGLPARVQLGLGKAAGRVGRRGWRPQLDS